MGRGNVKYVKDKAFNTPASQQENDLFSKKSDSNQQKSSKIARSAKKLTDLSETSPIRTCFSLEEIRQHNIDLIADLNSSGYCGAIEIFEPVNSDLNNNCNNQGLPNSKNSAIFESSKTSSVNPGNANYLSETQPFENPGYHFLPRPHTSEQPRQRMPPSTDMARLVADLRPSRVLPFIFMVLSYVTMHDWQATTLLRSSDKTGMTTYTSYEYVALSMMGGQVFCVACATALELLANYFEFYNSFKKKTKLLMAI